MQKKGRRVRCFASGEYGLSDQFVKIDGKYYKSQSIYEEDRRKKDIRKELVDYICDSFLGYYEGQPFPPILPQKLKELEFYDNEVILETFKQNERDIQFALSNKSFDNDVRRVSYMFAIVKNSIADVKRKFDASKRQERIEKQNTEETYVDIVGSSAPAKDITDWLEVD